MYGRVEDIREVILGLLKSRKLTGLLVLMRKLLRL